MNQNGINTFAGPEKNLWGKTRVCLEAVYTTFTLLYYTKIFWWAIPEHIRPVIWYPIYAIAAYLVFTERKRAAEIIRKADWLPILLLLIFASALWSIDPWVTLRRSLTLTGSTLFALYFVIRYGYKGGIRFLLWAFGITVILSALSPVLAPDHMIYMNAEKFRGVFTGKNMLGKAMALAALTFFLSPGSRNIRSALKLLFAVMALTLLIISNAQTALIAFVGAMVFLGIYVVMKKFRLFNIFLLALFFALWQSLFIWVNNNADTWLERMGKERTLTGRTEIWEEVSFLADDRPLVGYGYCALWTAENSPIIAARQNLDEEVKHAHNGFLQIRADLGWLGLLVYLLLFLQAVKRADLFSRENKGRQGLLPLGFLMTFFIMNWGYTTFILLNYITWPMFISICLLAPNEPA